MVNCIRNVIFAGKIMKKLFSPDFIFDSIHTITPEFLIGRKIRAVVLDIDNTLVTYGEAEPDEEVCRWVSRLSDAGIGVAIASNNNKDRVRLFNRKLGVFTVHESKKPSRRSVFAVCGRFGAKPEEIAVIGDQIFTDVLCANRAGAAAILVKPIPYAENLFFKFKRALEKPFIRKFRRDHTEKCFSKGDEVK